MPERCNVKITYFNPIHDFIQINKVACIRPQKRKQWRPSVCVTSTSKKKKVYILCAVQPTEAIDRSISDPILIEFRTSRVRLKTAFWCPD